MRLMIVRDQNGLGHHLRNNLALIILDGKDDPAR
jgi:hypothetical protein